MMENTRKRWAPWLLLLPVLSILAFFFLYPLIKMLLGGLFDPDLTPRHYERIFQDITYLQIIGYTFKIALYVTIGTFVLGYPLAYVLAHVRPQIAWLMLILIIVPYFTSILVRTYAWMVLLGSDGIVNQLLLALGLIDEPLKLMYTGFAVLLGMTYILLPYMVLTLYSVMRGIDTGLVSAARSLGASNFSAFRHVYFPLSLPGAAAGCLLVFILSIGFFITPALMGGAPDTMIAMVIESQVETYFDWGFASALATVLLVITLLLFLLYARVVGLQRLFEARL